MENKKEYINMVMKIDGKIEYIGVNKFGETYIVVSSFKDDYRYTLNLKNKFAYKGYIKLSLPNEAVKVYDVKNKTNTTITFKQFTDAFNVLKVNNDILEQFSNIFQKLNQNV